MLLIDGIPDILGFIYENIARVLMKSFQILEKIESGTKF